MAWAKLPVNRLAGARAAHPRASFARTSLRLPVAPIIPRVVEHQSTARRTHESVRIFAPNHSLCHWKSDSHAATCDLPFDSRYSPSHNKERQRLVSRGTTDLAPTPGTYRTPGARRTAPPLGRAFRGGARRQTWSPDARRSWFSTRMPCCRTKRRCVPHLDECPT